MTDLYDYPDGATPLDLDEIEGLIPTHIVNRNQLNELEQENITQARIWLDTAKFKKINTDVNLRKLHIQMFANVWKWAGIFRKTEKNVGVDPLHIAVDLRNLCDDVDAWIEYKSYPADEIAVRFHHRLTQIHPYPNGNGRHARLATDVLLRKQLVEKPFSWGSGSIENASDTRTAYIDALREADKDNYQPLMRFVRS